MFKWLKLKPLRRSVLCRIPHRKHVFRSNYVKKCRCLTILSREVSSSGNFESSPNLSLLFTVLLYMSKKMSDNENLKKHFSIASQTSFALCLLSRDKNHLAMWTRQSVVLFCPFGLFALKD